VENELLQIKDEALEKIEACTSLKELNDIIPVENKRIKIRAKTKITDNNETVTIKPVFDLPCPGPCSL
jgi:hypothetical protein